MTNTATGLIPEKTFQELDQFVSRLTRKQASLLDQINEEILSNLPQYQRMKDFRQPVQKVETVFLKKGAHLYQDEQITLKHALVAKLALHLPILVEKMNLPASILAEYREAFRRLADFLKNVGDAPYDSTGEFFCKDIRFALGLTIPGGACVFDVYSHISLSSVILSVFRSGKIGGIIRYACAGGSRPWYRGHVDSRYLTEINERGINKFYCRVSETLELHKEINGYVGSTWFFDPQLLTISPRLAFFQERPRKGGAFFLRHGSEQSDIEMAIKTSETRRRLYREGKYIPVCYSMLWPRKELMAWAAQYKN